MSQIKRNFVGVFEGVNIDKRDHKEQMQTVR